MAGEGSGPHASGAAGSVFRRGLQRMAQRRWAEAAALLQQHLQAHPDDADAHYWLGNAWLGAGDTAAAQRAFAAALRNQVHAPARWALAMACVPPVPLSTHEEARAVPAFAAALDALQQWTRTQVEAASVQAVGAQQPFYLAYIARDHRAVLAQYGALCTAQMAGWARAAGLPAPAPAHAGPLRVGIVSAHVHSHSVWHALLKGWLQHLDPARFALHVFHTGSHRDAETEWAAGHSHLHEDLGDWPACARTIAATRCDLLLYPEIGMDATTLRLAALRLARKQVAAWGHPITSGLPTMDAFLSAEAFEPEGAAAHYTEELVALPRLGCAYTPYGTQPEAVDLAPWDIAPSDSLLLCPGMPFKYRPADDALLADIARRCRPAKLVFFRAPGDAHADRLAQRLRVAFHAAGVSYVDSVRFIPWQPQAAFFGLLQRAHVCLDTTGFSGFNTVMQAVECGTPVVAWEGAFMRGRFAAAVLRQMDLGAWVASTHADYADKVQQLCESAALRETVRGQLRERSGRLYDDRASVAALAAHLERLAAT